MTTVHVIPMDDLLAHENTEECACLPVTEPVPTPDGGVGWLVTHSAWDGRP
jgi:hypothetical protein